MRILIIGGGNMGLTFVHSFLRSHIASKENVMILEKSHERAAILRKKDVCKVYGEPDGCIESADLIIFAVKPQDAHHLFEKMKPYVDPQQVFLSIMAGLKIQTICEELGVEKVIRAMPNLPTQIGLGMTALTSTDEVTRIELAMVLNLLNTTGKTIYVDNESFIDAATAISGSGPAYVWYFMDAMIKAAKEMGFSESEAELLVNQTFRGAVDLYNKTDFSLAEWIQKVCSKGGTTEAALESYRTTAVHEDIISGARAALSRAVELGKE